MAEEVTNNRTEINIIPDAMLADYKKTAIKWDKLLRQLPVRAAADVLKYFTSVPGLRGKKRFGYISGKSQFAPFNRDRVTKASVDIEYREIETFHSNVIEEFSPADYIDLPIFYDDPVISEAIKRAGSTLKVLAQLQIARGQHIAQCAMTGRRNAAGNTTLDICDGLITTIMAEIAAGNISEAKGNLIKVGEAVTDENCYDVTKEVNRAMNHFLKRENNFLFVPSDYEDKYNVSYLTTHTGIVYNTQYEQPYVEGSKKKLTIVGLPELDGCDYGFITQTSNMLHGFYSAADATFMDIIRQGHYDISSASDMWMGFQFHTIDPRKFMAVDLTVATPPTGGGQQEGEEH